jgi:hypothetical protein
MNTAENILTGIPELSYGNPSPVCYIGAVMRLLSYLGDPIAEDELIALSGVGLCFPWAFASDCDEVSIIPDIPRRTFGALGYDSEYYVEDITPVAAGGRGYAKEFYIEHIRRAIDAGRPVIGFGLVTDVYACLITGYYDGGNGLCVSSCHTQERRTANWYDRCRGILVVGEKTGERLIGEAAYQRLVEWAAWCRASRSRPVTAHGITYPLGEAAYAALCEWLQNDEAWQELTSHEAFLKQSGVLLVGYYRTNLFSYLQRLDARYPGVVNPPALAELARMCTLFPGSHVSDLWLQECVDPAITDVAMLRDRALREKVAQYVTQVRNGDNCLQWTLFMPGYVQRQVGQSGITLESFAYRTMPPLRFIGVEAAYEEREASMRVLDAMPEWASEFDYDIYLIHHNGRQHYEEAHGVWGRFLHADAPVPDGCVHLDFMSPDAPAWTHAAGSPYLSQFAFAVFAGSEDALHKEEGFDANAMYDITRNIILGEGVCIPYPEKYWTAEVRFDRSDGSVYNPEHVYHGELKPGAILGGYLFSVDLGADGGK